MAARILNMIPSDEQKTAQLPPILPLAVGCNYEITVNVSVADGLVNGAGGVVKFLQLTASDSSAVGTVWSCLMTAMLANRQCRQSSTVHKTYQPTVHANSAIIKTVSSRQKLFSTGT